MWDLLDEVSLLMSEDGGAGADASKSNGSGEVELTPESKWLLELFSELKGSKEAAPVLKGSSGIGEWPDEKAVFPGFVSAACPSKFGMSCPAVPDSKDMSSSKSVVGLELCTGWEDSSWSASTFSKSSKFKESRFDPADTGSCCWLGAGSMGPNFENWSKSDMMRTSADTDTGTTQKVITLFEYNTEPVHKLARSSPLRTRPHGPALGGHTTQDTRTHTYTRTDTGRELCCLPPWLMQEVVRNVISGAYFLAQGKFSSRCSHVTYRSYLVVLLCKVQGLCEAELKT